KMLPYRLAVLLLLCLSIGAASEAEVGTASEQDNAAASETGAAEQADAGVEAATVEDGDGEAGKHVVMDIATGEIAEVEPEIEYEWKPFLEEFANATCPNLQGLHRWQILVDYQCPGLRSWYSCIDDLLELPQYRRYRCRRILFRWEKIAVNRTAAKNPNEIAIRPEEVHMAGANFIAALKERGRHGSNFCMMMMFFAPSCPFSAHWAPYFNALPPRYKEILFVAVNASDPANNRMNSRLGIAGTPTMVLYVDGVPVARVDEQADPATHLPKFIEGFTDWYTTGDLQPFPEGNVQVVTNRETTDYWLVVSVVVYMIATIYHVVGYTAVGKRKWAELLQRVRG
ncbi:hypothetical protein PFISCL1PPCAC_16809, partial [Pristionchus fissidentatus]